MSRTPIFKKRTRQHDTCGPIRQIVTDLDAIVRHYIRNFRPKSEGELRHFRNQPNLSESIRRAALAKDPDEKRFKHQRRIPAKTLQVWAEVLHKKASQIQQCETFDHLFEMAENESRKLWGIGELCVYDTALRIGTYLGLEPNEVFLHAGTRDAARALGLDGVRRAVPLVDLPNALRQLKPREIEDCLCIYKDQLKTLMRKKIQ